MAEFPEVGTVSQGSTIDGALDNLKEDTELYFEEFPLTESDRSWLTSFEATCVYASEYLGRKSRSCLGEVGIRKVRKPWS